MTEDLWFAASSFSAYPFLSVGIQVAPLLARKGLKVLCHILTLVSWVLTGAILNIPLCSLSSSKTGLTITSL